MEASSMHTSMIMDCHKHAISPLRDAADSMSATEATVVITTSTTTTTTTIIMHQPPSSSSSSSSASSSSYSSLRNTYSNRNFVTNAPNDPFLFSEYQRIHFLSSFLYTE